YRDIDVTFMSLPRAWAVKLALFIWKSGLRQDGLEYLREGAPTRSLEWFKNGWESGARLGGPSLSGTEAVDENAHRPGGGGHRGRAGDGRAGHRRGGRTGGRDGQCRSGRTRGWEG